MLNPQAIRKKILLPGFFRIWVKSTVFRLKEERIFEKAMEKMKVV